MSMSKFASKFDYLLNAFELASQSKHPAAEGYADKRRALLDYVRDLERSRYVSRDGWKLVPTEATAEMVQAAEDRHVEGSRYIAENSIQFALWREVWRAMLQAAPRCESSE